MSMSIPGAAMFNFSSGPTPSDYKKAAEAANANTPPKVQKPAPAAPKTGGIDIVA